MSDAISTLGLDIDTSGLKDGERSLDSFNRKTEDTAQQAGRLETAFRDGARSAQELAAALAAAAGGTAGFASNTIEGVTGAARNAMESLYSRFENLNSATNGFLNLVGGATFLTVADNFIKAAEGAQTFADAVKDGARELSGAKQVLTQVTTLFGGLFVAREVSQSIRAMSGSLFANADAWRYVQNQIKTVVSGVNEVEQAQQGVFDIAMKTYASYEGTATLFARLTRSGAEWLQGQEDALSIVDTINKALLIGGATVAEQQSTITQLSQALSGGVLQGDELRSLRENASILFEAVTGYIRDTFGVGRDEFRKFASSGKLTSEVILEAFRRAKSSVDDTFRELSNPTIAQSMVKLSTAWKELIGSEGDPFFRLIASSIGLFADNLKTLTVALVGASAALAAFLAYNWKGVVAFVVNSFTTLLSGITTTTVATKTAWLGLRAAVFGVVPALVSFALANPFTAMLATITAATLAITAFGDRIRVAKRDLLDIPNFSIEGPLPKDWEPQIFQGLEITLKDRLEAVFNIARQELAELGDWIGVWVSDIYGRFTVLMSQIFGPEFAAKVAAIGSAIGQALSGVGAAFEAAGELWIAYTAAAAGAFETVKAVWAELPSAMGYAAIEAANFVIDKIEWMINSAIGLLNGALEAVNKSVSGITKQRIALLEEVNLARLENQYRGVGERLGAAFTRGYEAQADRTRTFMNSIGAFLQAQVDRVTEEENRIAIERARREQRRARELAGGKGGGAAGEPDEDYLKAMRERAQMLADLQRQAEIVQNALANAVPIAALDEQLNIVATTNSLLREFAPFYQAAGKEAENIARADAESVVSLETSVRLGRDLVGMRERLARVPRLAAALTISVEEYDLLQEAFDLMERIPELTEDAARAEAAKQIAANRTVEELDRQAKRARDLVEAPARNWIEGLEQAGDDFWTNWVDRGFDAFDSLADAFRDMWKRLQADILRRAFEPIAQSIRRALGVGAETMGSQLGVQIASAYAAQGFGFPGSGGGAGPSFHGIPLAFLQSAGAAQSGSGAGAGGGFSFGGIRMDGLRGLGAAMVASRGNMDLLSIGGFLNGKGEIGKELAKIVGSQLGGFINKVFTPGAAIGSMLGSGFANLLGINGKNSGIGGSIGGMAGAFFGGPIGSAIGSFIGSTIGSLIGPKPSNQGAQAFLDARGQVVGVGGSKRTSETEGGAREAAKAVAEGQDLLRRLGANLGATVDMLLIGTRDLSRFSLTGDPREINTGAVGDPGELAKTALRSVLQSATFAAPALQAVSDAMLSAGRGFDDIVGVLGVLADVIPDLTEPTSEWAAALKKINDAFATVRSQAGDSGPVEAAYQQAVGALRDQFNKGISADLLKATAPLQSQLEDLLKTQTSRVADAVALGADMAKVSALNNRELADFIKGAGSSAGAFVDLAAVFENLKAAALAAGREVATLTTAFEQVKASLRAEFEKSISDALLEATKPLQAELSRLLESQASRVANAAALGADMGAVLQLNSVEMKAFIERAGSSADAFAQLNKEFSALRETALAAGRDVGAMDQAFEAARRQIVTDFDEGTGDAMRRLTNETLARLQDMLQAQKARLEQAKAIGANIVAVDRLNALETQRFFQGLSDDARRELGDYLGIIEDYNGKIAVTLQKLGDELSLRIDQMEEQRQTLLDSAANFRDLAQGINDTRQSIIDRYSDLTPIASLEELRSRFGRVADDARGGNESALQALPQVAQQIIDLSRSLYGSTTTFRADYDLVTRVLGDVSGATMDRAATLESQAATLVDQRDLLIRIRDALESPDPALDFLQQQVGLLDQNNSLIAMLLQAYLDLNAEQARQVITDAALANASLSAPIVTGAQTAAPGGVTSGPQSGGAGEDVSQVMAASVDVTQAGFTVLGKQLEEIYRELRRLNTTMSAAA